MAVLKIERITKRFGGITALDQVSFSVARNELVALIGPNGSGKTTLFNCVAGELRPDSGTIYINGINTSGWPVNQIARLGLSRTYQQIEVFPKLTVRENLFVAGQEAHKIGLVESLLKSRKVKALDTRLEEETEAMIEMLGLMDQAEEYGGDLSYGQRKILAIGMALMSKPEILLLDEPVAAVNPTMISKIIKILMDIKARGFTILIVEHNLPVVMEIAERIVVVNSGKKLLEGPPEVIRKDQRVIEAYFGG